MTDLATRPDADGASLGENPTEQLTIAGADAATPESGELQWAPAEPAPRKRRLGLWIGIPAGAALLGLVASSLVLIAPGTSIAGVPVGFHTSGAAADAVQNRLAETTIVLTGAGGDVEVTGADLGATVNAEALADAAFAEHPMWNPTTWFSSPADATVTIDKATAAAALRDAAPSLYTDPVDAQIAFDPATASYVAIPAEPGEGIDVESVRAALQEALVTGSAAIELEPVATPIPAVTGTSVANGTVNQLNSMLDTVGFYVGGERTVPIDRAVAASWITLGEGPNGTFSIDVDQTAIQAVVDTLPAAVNREPVNASVITDSGGDVLRELAAGVTGRTLESTDGIAAAFAEQLAGGNAAYALPVTETEFATAAIARRISVDLSEQRVYLFENDQVVRSFLASTGLSGPTNPGSFRIFAHVRIQGMGDPNLVFADYYTPDVPWVTYFDGDIAFHGTYWHNNFGTPMSHGCVNLTIDDARFLYEWAPDGTEVNVHA